MCTCSINFFLTSPSHLSLLSPCLTFHFHLLLLFLHLLLFSLLCLPLLHLRLLLLFLHLLLFPLLFLPLLPLSLLLFYLLLFPLLFLPLLLLLPLPLLFLLLSSSPFSSPPSSASKGFAKSILAATASAPDGMNGTVEQSDSPLLEVACQGNGIRASLYPRKSKKESKTLTPRECHLFHLF